MVFARLSRKVRLVLSIGAVVHLGRGSRFNRLLQLRARKGDVITIGKDCLIDAVLRTDRSPARITIGDRTQIGAKGMIVAAEEVSIGADVIISWDLTITDHNSHPVAWEHRQHDSAAWLRGEKAWSHVVVRPVRIEDKVWIGFGVAILKGVKIGEGAIVGAGAVVTQDVAPWTIVGGNPAKVIGLVPRA